MKTIAILFILIFGGAVIYQTYPGTDVPDYSRPHYVIEDGRVFKTYPGTTTPDYGAPEYFIERNPVYRHGKSFRDYSKRRAINFDSWTSCPDVAE